jgi:hypothetical protein
MNHENHVISEEVFTSVNLLPKIFERKIKASTTAVSA